MASIDTIGRRVADWCGGSKVLALLFAANILLSAVLMTVCVLSGSAADRIVRLFTLSSDFHIFLSHPWTLVTYMMVQLSVLHLLFNMLWLYWFGKFFLDAWPERTLLWAYIGGGLTAGILYLVTCNLGGNSGGMLAGSSGAVLALMTAVTVRMPDYPVNFLLVGEVRMKWLAPIAILLTVLGASGGALVAHVGGVAFGAVFALASRRRPANPFPDMRPEPTEDKRRRVFRPSEEGAENVADILSERRRMHERLDELLDKVRISGYASLSAKERKELDDISSKLK